MDSRNRAEEMDAQNAQSGKPVYEDTTAEAPHGNTGTDLGNGAVPAYRYSNPRYWEYR